MKGYWVTTGTIHTPLGMVAYLAALQEWMPTVGARFLIREIASDVREGSPGAVTVVIEFPSLAAAVEAYESAEYQALIQMRLNSSDLTLSISEELQS